jgi:hypothetical protein
MSPLTGRFLFSFLLAATLSSDALAERRTEQLSEDSVADEKFIASSVTQFFDGDNALTEALLGRAEKFLELGYLTVLASKTKNADESLNCGTQEGEDSPVCRPLAANIESSKAELESLPLSGVLTRKLESINMGILPVPSPTPGPQTTTTSAPTASPTPTPTPTPSSRFSLTDFYCLARNLEPDLARPSLPIPNWLTESESEDRTEPLVLSMDLFPPSMSPSTSAYTGPMAAPSSLGGSGDSSSQLPVDSGSPSSSGTGPSISGVFYTFTQDERSLHIEAGKTWIGSPEGIAVVDRFEGMFNKENSTDFSVHYGWGLRFPLGKFDIICTFGVFIGDN